MNVEFICMQPMIKRILWVLLLASGLQNSWAFSVSGPSGNGGDAWQIPANGYGALKAPKNLGEEYRRNTPVMYYAFDQNFLDYFGPEGASAIDNAYVVLNALTNVDSYSKLLSEFPLNSRHKNFQAQALGILDLKSYTLGMMTEQLGLANPIQYSWILHDRFHVGSIPCPVGMEYLVVQRNFDYFSTPLNQLQSSAYVNNILYTYYILEDCGPPDPLAVTVPYSVDPLADTYSPVAAWVQDYPGLDIDLPYWGDYYTGLTRDDVAGFRYLLSTNNINWETPSADSLTVVTNTLEQDLFPTSITTNSGVLYNGTFYGTASYAALASFASTNNQAAVQAAFPGLQATLLANYFTNMIVTNTVFYYTNYYGETIGTPPHFIQKKVPTQTIVQYFKYSFDNIFTNIYQANSISKVQAFTVAPQNGAPLGSPSTTNLTKTLFVTNSVPAGEFYILPTNSPCGLDIISTLVTFTNYSTNLLATTFSTNAVNASTNITLSTNSGNYSYTMEVTPSIAHVYVINPVICTTSNAVTGLYQGIGEIKFVRADYDSLLGQYWQPMTNDYSMMAVTNSKAVVQHFRRIVTEPDFLFSAEDMANGPGTDPGVTTQRRNLNFDTDNVLAGLAGPGTITTPTTITYNKSGPVYYNSSEDVMDGSPYFNETPGGDAGINDLYYSWYFVWGCYDGTTNAPIVFPNGTSYENLADQVLIQISPASLPLGTGDGQTPYPSTTFTATGGSFTQPYTWSSSDSQSGSGTGLPSGMMLSADGVLSGTPTQSGTFDFNLKLTDYVGRSVQWTYTLTIQ